MSEQCTIWTMGGKDSTPGGMAHLRRYGDDAAKCGAEPTCPTDYRECKRVVEEAAKGGAKVYLCATCFG
jgi:hypothetical protein